MAGNRFRRFRPFRGFARSRKAETALAARFFSRFRDFDGESKPADGRIQGHPRRRLFGSLVIATPANGVRFFRDFEIPFSTKTESRNLRAQNFVRARRRSTGNRDNLVDFQYLSASRLYGVGRLQRNSVSKGRSGDLEVPYPEEFRGALG